MSVAKQEVEALLKKLPDECTLEDVQYHLYVLEKIHHSIKISDEIGTISQEEVESKLSKWTTQ